MSAAPPVHLVSPGIVLRVHVLPPSREEPTRSLRDWSGPTSCFQVATIVCHSNCRRDKLDLFLSDWVFQKIEAAGIRLQS